MENKTETRRERFIRIAEARTNKIINMVQLLGNCSNLSSYEYTQKDVNKMFKAIEEAISSAKQQYYKNGGKDNKKFSFDD